VTERAIVTPASQACQRLIHEIASRGLTRVKLSTRDGRAVTVDGQTPGSPPLELTFLAERIAGGARCPGG
jgi:hypothetical protein